MARQLYYFAIFLFVIQILQEVLITKMLTSVGPAIYSLGSFIPFLILVSFTQVICSSVILRYCYQHHYIWSYWTGWLCVIMLSVHTAVVYEILVHQNLGSWYFYSYCAVFGANLLLGVSLVVSKSRQVFWLKWIGIASICLNTAQIVLLIWYSVFADMEMKAMLSQAGLGLSGLMIAATALWILHFITLLKTDKRHTGLSALPMVGFILLAVMVSYFSISLGTDFCQESVAPLPIRKVSATERTLADRFEEHLYVGHDGEKIPYRLMKPLDYNSNQKYPVVLCLHHGGAHGRDNVAQVQGSYAPVLANYDNRRNHPAFLLIPQCEVGKSWMDPDVDSAIMESLVSLEKQNSIDTLRRYVIGESGGGYGSWHFIGAHPGMFAAAIPVCGGGESELVENMADVSIWAFHGSDDLHVPVKYSREMVNALRKAGSKPRYTEFAGADHYIGKRVAETPGIWDWFFAQKRKN